MGAAAAAMMMRERRVIEAFTVAAATSPERAVPIETLGIEYDALALRRLQQHAVIREVAPGRLYLDVPTWQALRRMRLRIVFVLFGIILIALVVVLILDRSRTSR